MSSLAFLGMNHLLAMDFLNSTKSRIQSINLDNIVPNNLKQLFNQSTMSHSDRFQSPEPSALLPMRREPEEREKHLGFLEDPATKHPCTDIVVVVHHPLQRRDVRALSNDQLRMLHYSMYSRYVFHHTRQHGPFPDGLNESGGMRFNIERTLAAITHEVLDRGATWDPIKACWTFDPSTTTNTPPLARPYGSGTILSNDVHLTNTLIAKINHPMSVRDLVPLALQPLDQILATLCESTCLFGDGEHLNDRQQAAKSHTIRVLREFIHRIEDLIAECNDDQNQYDIQFYDRDFRMYECGKQPHFRISPDSGRAFHAGAEFEWPMRGDVQNLEDDPIIQVWEPGERQRANELERHRIIYGSPEADPSTKPAECEASNTATQALDASHSTADATAPMLEKILSVLQQHTYTVQRLETQIASLQDEISALKDANTAAGISDKAKDKKPSPSDSLVEIFQHVLELKNAGLLSDPSTTVASSLDVDLDSDFVLKTKQARQGEMGRHLVGWNHKHPGKGVEDTAAAGIDNIGCGVGRVTDGLREREEAMDDLVGPSAASVLLDLIEDDDNEEKGDKVKGG